MAGDRMSGDGAPQGRVFATAEDLAQGVADWIVERARQSRSRFAICLSGGETPRRLYELLAEPERCARFPWQRAHFFWGDERFVPRDDPRSNFHMAWQALLQRVPVPPDNIHAIPTERTSAEAGAADYQAVLARFYGAQALHAEQPLFDLTLLGLGEDGHTASLFPGSPALAESRRWAIAVADASALDRITLTYPALASSAAVAFLVAGERKRAVLTRVRAGDASLPAARLHPVGSLFWFVDRAAAAMPAFSGE
jgi:6-phosphogluconolactonase